MKFRLKTSQFISSLSLKKKYFYFKNMNKLALKLKFILNNKQDKKRLSSLSIVKKKINFEEQYGVVVVYIISFLFTSTNTFLYVMDASGNVKARYSAGFVEFKGKQKRRRMLVLRRFFRELVKLKITVLKNMPIALHLNNVGFYKYFIIKKLKKKLFIRLVKSYETYSYNGCRRKKKLRK